MNRFFIDMDGVIVDFEAYVRSTGLTPDEIKRTDGAYLAMPAIAGALDGVRSLIGMGFEVWIATKPPTGVPYAYRDKAAWILQHLPELKRRIIITHDKGLLGGAGDYLLDDRPHKANCETFTGTLIPFINGMTWEDVLNRFRPKEKQPNSVRQPSSGITTDPNDPDLTRGVDSGPVSQAKKYLVLSEEERAKGFVRPVRQSYIHVGQQPKNALRELTADERERYINCDYVAFELYPEGESAAIGRFWTQAQLDNKGCGGETTMGLALCETYARDPKFYGSTYCCACAMHRPVAEFKWKEDGQVVGS